MFKKIGNFFKALIKCSFRELMSILLDILSYLFSVPSLFVNFFIVFYLTNSEMTPTQKGSAFVIIGVFLALWGWINGILKRDMLDHKQPYDHIVVRMLYKCKYMFIIALVLYLYTIKVEYTQVLIFLGACVVTYSLSVLFRAIWLKLNRKDWEYEYTKRTYKF